MYLSDAAHKNPPTPTPGKVTSVPCIPPPITYAPTHSPTANPWRLIGKNSWASSVEGSGSSSHKPLRIMQRDASLGFCKASCLGLDTCTGFTHNNKNHSCYMYIPTPVTKLGWDLQFGVPDLTSSELKRGYIQKSSNLLISYAKKDTKKGAKKKITTAPTKAPMTGTIRQVCWEQMLIFFCLVQTRSHWLPGTNT